jgi:ATP synthase F1 complex assembly factor 2
MWFSKLDPIIIPNHNRKISQLKHLLPSTLFPIKSQFLLNNNNWWSSKLQQHLTTSTTNDTNKNIIAQRPLGLVSVSGDMWKSRARFYRQVDIRQTPDKQHWLVTLDERVLKTPNRHPFIIPSKILASLVAHEWDCQIKTLETSTMPLTMLCATAIEITKTKRIPIITEMLRFLVTDLVCFPIVVSDQENGNFNNLDEDSRRLFERQQKAWEIPLQHFKKRYGELDQQGILATPSHPIDTINNVKTRLSEMNEWELTSIQHLAQGCKSLVIPLALIDHAITCQQTIDAARVEEDHQIEQWGLVEGSHDVELANIKLQITSAALLNTLSKIGY